MLTCVILNGKSERELNSACLMVATPVAVESEDKEEWPGPIQLQE
jgi:hypothetical protein